MSSPLSYLGTPAATTTIQGKVRLATTAETIAGLRDDIAITPEGAAGLITFGAPAASTSQAGIIQIATNGEAAAQTATNLALVPSNIPSILAAPGAIGGSTPGSGAFTSLSASGAFSLTGDTVQVAEGGTAIASYTAGDMIYASGATTLAKLAKGTARQILQMNAGATAPEWTSNMDIPGTLDVTGAVDLDDSLTVDGASTLSGLITGGAGATINGGALNLGTDNAANAVNLGVGTTARTIQIGNSAAAHLVRIGSATGAAELTLKCGTGNFSLDGAATSTYTFAPSTTSGTINFGGTGANTGAMTIAGGTGAQTISIANNTGIKTINIAGDSATSANIIKIGTGAGNQTLTIGSTNSTSTTTIQAGSGGVNLTGDVNLTAVATKISLNGGAATDFIGRATLVGGTVTVNNTNIAAGDRIIVTRSALNASPALGFPITTINAGVSFTIASFSAAGAAVATDVSTFDYIIFRQT